MVHALDASADNRGFTGHEHDPDLVNMRGRMYYARIAVLRNQTKSRFLVH